MGAGVAGPAVREQGQQAAGDDGQQRGDLAEEAAQGAGQQQDAEDHREGDHDVRDLAVVRVLGVVSGDHRRGRADQRQADDGDDDPGHQRREEADHLGEGLGYQQAEHARAQHRAVDVRQPFLAAELRGDGDHRRDHGEGGAGHHRQPDAEQLADADRLDQRGDPGDQQIGVDQQGDGGGGELERAADDERDGDGAGVHDEQVLQAQDGQPGRRQDFVDGMDRASRVARGFGSIARATFGGAHGGAPLA